MAFAFEGNSVKMPLIVSFYKARSAYLQLADHYPAIEKPLEHHGRSVFSHEHVRAKSRKA